MPEICENWLGIVNICVCYAHQTREIHLVMTYSVDFKTLGESWNPLSKTVFSECSLVWYKGHVNIWNDPKAQTYLRVNIFLNF